jgi:hypothetical protein
MAYLALIFNFIIAIPKIWGIIKEVAQWIEAQKRGQKETAREEAKRQIHDGKTEKEREDAADRFIDND